MGLSRQKSDLFDFANSKNKTTKTIDLKKHTTSRTTNVQILLKASKQSVKNKNKYTNYKHRLIQNNTYIINRCIQVHTFYN